MGFNSGFKGLMLHFPTQFSLLPIQITSQLHIKPHDFPIVTMFAAINTYGKTEVMFIIHLYTKFLTHILR